MNHIISFFALILTCAASAFADDLPVYHVGNHITHNLPPHRLKAVFASISTTYQYGQQLGPGFRLEMHLVNAEPGTPIAKSEVEELHADDAAVMRRVVGFMEVTAEPKRVPRPEATGFEWAKNKAHRLSVLCDAQGHIVELRGNGPWLSNEALGQVAKLPKLRVIYMDHNIPPPGSDVPHSTFDGSGFSAFQGGTLESVLIGHALTNEGARALASIPSLRSMHIEHARVTGEGIRLFTGHRMLERFGWACPGRWDEAAFFETAASLPKVKELVFKEAIATYDGGLSRLRPVAGRVQKLELPMTLSLPADLERFHADHPQTEVVAILPKHFEQAATKLKGRMSPELKAWAEAELARMNGSR